MHFLEYLDEQYKVYREKNNQYRYYEEIVAQNMSDYSQKFEMLMIGNKAKILVRFKSLRVYLSDLDILNLILILPEDEFNWFVNEFINISKKRYSLFEFKINDRKFRGIGLPYKNTNVKVWMHTDNEITINSLIFIINVILTKDLLGTIKLRKSKNPDKKEKDLLKATIYKYITLLKYYRIKDSNFTNYLKHIGYPIDEKLNDVFSSYGKTKKINQLFENYKIFEEKNLI